MKKEEINQKVLEYIKKDDRKGLWNLVFLYMEENKEIIDMSKISDYYIEKRDSFYICELISLAIEYLDIDDVINKIIATNDKEFIAYVMTNPVIKGIIDDGYFIRLNHAYEKL